MDDLTTPRFTLSQIAFVLGVTVAEARALRSETIPQYRIPASDGEGSRTSARWSALDACRLAIVSEVAYPMGPQHRRALFGDLADGELIRAHTSTPPHWLVLSPFGRSITTDPLSCWKDPHGWHAEPPLVSGGATVINLTYLLQDTIDSLEQVLANPERSTWSAYLRRGQPGRRRKADLEAVKLARALQELFDARRVDFKALSHVRNLWHGMRLAHDLIEPAICALAPDIRQRAAKDCVWLLKDQPRIAGAFGQVLAAKVCGCSSRSISSAMRQRKP